MRDPVIPDDNDDLLAAELALGSLAGDDLVAARNRLASDRDFSQRVAQWQERLIAMTDDIAPQAPPARAKSAVMARLFPATQRPLWQRLGLWQGLSVAALALAALLGLFLLQPGTPQGAGPLYATQMQAEGSDFQVLALYDPARGDVALTRLSGAAPQGRVLELWAILPDTPPLSLGVMPQDAKARLPIPEALAALASSITFAITDEPQGGAPGGVPSGSVLAAGLVTEL
ncbi:MAG: anti-sigma factor [Sulfitobacter sp.]